jgi:endo-1,3(4)-beta-glucanase
MDEDEYDDINADSDLLMFSMPHQQSTFMNPQYENKLKVDTLVGDMIGVIGTKWLMKTPAVPTSYASFRAPRPIDQGRMETLKLQLLKDIESSAIASEPDPYGFGKSIAKIGRMVLMADEIGMDKKLIDELLAKMKTLLKPWLESTNNNALLYDSLYGGIVSKNGVKDPAEDFGQGYYNDHHFHYGYILYGCAVLTKFDGAWGSTYRENIVALLRDYANPSKDDPYFPILRQYDVYDGHSWAAGLFVFADGRNQESSSESMNAYYSMMLLGESFGDARMSELGRVLTSLEIYGTQKYWHSREGHTVYPKVFADNKCIGMKWSDKVVEATWFAAGMVYIHGINMLPFTPLSELYLTAPWIKEEYPVVISSVTSEITDEWKGFLYGTHCVIDEPAAWSEIVGLTSFDGGNTRSNLMYFCATRPKGDKDNEKHTLVDETGKQVEQE